MGQGKGEESLVLLPTLTHPREALLLKLPQGEGKRA